MSYRITAERLGDTVLMTIDTGEQRVLASMTAGDAVQFGWDMLALGASDSPALTPEAVITGQRLT